MKRFVLIVLSFFFLGTPALAAGSRADMWIVSQRSGDARVVHRGMQLASLTVNAAVAPGDVVITGTSGRATLARGSDYIVIAPHSELRLPAEAQPSGFTRVVQQLGTMLFKVKHTGVPHFAVDTPMLAAVVKGTTFTVVVEHDRSAVQVIEGVVQVTASEGGMQRLVEGGNTVFVDRNNPKQLITADAETLGASGSTSETSVEVGGSAGESLSTVADLTGGLVQAEPVVVATSTSPTIADLIEPAVATDVGDTAAEPGSGTTPDASGDALAPITDPVLDTVVTPVAETVVTPVLDPVVNTVIAPIVDTIVTPVLAPIVDTIVTPVLSPIVDTIVAPVVTPVVDTIVAPVVAPIVNTVVAPIIDTVVAPVVNTVVAPVVNTVVAPVVAPVVNTVVAPVVNTVVAPVLAPVVNTVVAPVLAPITQALPSLLNGL